MYNSYFYKIISLKIICIIFLREKPEFILVAQKDRILRLSLNNKSYEVLPVRKLENVIAVEFDMKNNCVFWADIVTDTIGV